MLMFSTSLSRRIAVLALAAATTLVGLSIPTFAGSQVHESRARRVVGRTVAGSRVAITRYWTKERMRTAVPLDIVVDAKSQAATVADAGPSGVPGEVPGIAPTTRAAATAEAAPEGARRMSGPFPYSRYEITNPATYPYSASGKVFFSLAGGNYVCSATAVTSENKSAVITAGHCVNDGAGGPWATNWAFAPGYRNGVAPYGVWPADSLYTTTGWVNEASFPQDIGGAIIRPNSSGQLLVDVVGGRGIAWNQSAEQAFKSFGYPAVALFDGSKLFVCESDFGMRDTWVPGSGPDPIGIGCDMTGGSSGGGWMIQDSFVNSVNSYKIVGEDEVMFGPYFDSVAEALYNTVSEPSTSPSPSPSPSPGDPTPTPTPTPSPTPTPPGQPTVHKVTVSLELVQNLVAKGTMKAVDGYKPCTRNAPIKVQRRAGSSWKKVGMAFTNEFGRYRAKVAARPGRYRVVSPKGIVDDMNLCSATRSPVRRAR